MNFSMAEMNAYLYLGERIVNFVNACFRLYETIRRTFGSRSTEEKLLMIPGRASTLFPWKLIGLTAVAVLLGLALWYVTRPRLTSGSQLLLS